LIQTYSENLLPVSSKIFSENISEMPFILYNRGSITRRHIDETFRRNAMQPIIFAESTSVTFMRELALLGCGVALLPENFVKQDLKTNTLKQQKMKITWERDYGLFVQKEFNLQNPFINDLQKALEKLK
jgi:DNA-binding transcriptional LysR family regulator